MADVGRAIAFVTLGCKVNQYDAESMAEALRREGWLVVERPVDLPAGRGVIVVNSCTVTARAAAKSRQAARSVARRLPGAAVVLAGCYPQAYPGEAGQVAGLAGVAGTGRMATLELVRRLAASPARDADSPNDQTATATDCAEVGLVLANGFELLPAAPVRGRVRAFLKVQEGCQMNCAYCIVPQARGPQRSAAPADVLAAATDLLAQGAKEIVLTGIHLGAYGSGDKDADLATVVRGLLSLPGLLRLRLSSIEPTDVTASLLAALASDRRCCRHLHIPLQSGSARVLAAMGRHCGPAEYLAVVDRARTALPGLALSTDVLAGLPGETAADVADTEQLIRAVGFMRLHVFPYSPRPGTRAAAMVDQVPVAERERRASYLTAVGHDLALAYHEGLIGREREVLLERHPEVLRSAAGQPAGYGNEGLGDDYVRVVARGPVAYPAGTMARVQVVAATAAEVAGIIVEPVERA